MNRKLFIFILLFSIYNHCNSQNSISRLITSAKNYGSILFDIGRSYVVEITDNRNYKPKGEIDLSNKLPKPLDQGKRKSCWAFSSTYGLITNLVYIQKGIKNINKCTMSPELPFLMSGKCLIKGGESHTYLELINTMKSYGCISIETLHYQTENCYLENLTDKIKSDANDNIKNFKFKYYEPHFISKGLNNSIKKALDRGYPLIVNMVLDDHFKSLTCSTWTGPKYEQLHSHSMIVVGYSEKTRCYKVMNSNGDTWGDSGYIWIPYKLIDTYAVDFGYIDYIGRKKDTGKIDSIQPDSKKSKQGGFKDTIKLLDTTYRYTELISSDSTIDSVKLKLVDSMTSWFKKGYYRPFDSFRIGNVYFTRKKKFKDIYAHIEVRDLKTGLTKYRDFYIDIGTTVQYIIVDNVYHFSFDSRCKRGKDIFNPKAVCFTIKKYQIIK